MSQDDCTGRIAVIGMAGRFPGAANIEQYWHLIAAGKESVRFFDSEEIRALGVPEEVRNHPSYVPAAAVLDDMDRFDADYFGLTPVEAKALDPQQRLLLECAVGALEDAGHARPGPRVRVGVFAGVTRCAYLIHQLLKAPAFLSKLSPLQTIIASDKSFAATQVSYKLGLRGPSMSVDTACSTSLVAVHQACQSLLQYECDMALAGGSSVAMPCQTGHVYQPGGIFSPDGHCRPFDATAQGTVRGSGVGVIVLKRLDDALADGDCIDAIILGSAINNDGAAKVGFTAPSVIGQREVIEAAHAIAEIDARTIGMVEAHGTGTPLGDPIEVAALASAFRSSTTDKQFCALGSVKGNIGHLDAAAGIAGFIKAVLALRNRSLPPTPHFVRQNREIALEETPFVVHGDLRPWLEQPWPRRAAVSAFGIGGTNAHVVLEEAPPQEQVRRDAQPRILTLSANTASALAQLRDRMTAALAAFPPEFPLDEVAGTLQHGRNAHRYRMTCIASTVAEAGRELASAAVPSSHAYASNEERSEVVFLFPGQGTQYPGMARPLYRTNGTFRALLDQCAKLLNARLGCDLRTLLVDANADDAQAAELLGQTRYAQPALFVVEYALAKVLEEAGVQPDVLVGHSLGELTAAAIAGVFTLEDALTVVAARGRLMHSIPDGGLLAVPLSEAGVLPYLRQGCELAAFNTPEQTVLAGPPEVIAEHEARLLADGVSVHRLSSTRAFHSAAMEPVMAEFAQVVAGVPRSAPRLTVLSNVSGMPFTVKEACDPWYWAEQMRRPVRFSQALGRLPSRGARVFVEVGPGQVLGRCALAHSWPATPRCISCLDTKEMGEAVSPPTLRMLAALWSAGVPVDWTALGSASGRRVHLPTYPFQGLRHWVDAAQSEPSPSASPATDGAFLYEAGWLRIDRPVAPASRSEAGIAWCVIESGGAIAGALGDAAPVHRAEIGVPQPGACLPVFRLRGATEEAYAELFRALPLDGIDRLKVVHCVPASPGGAEMQLEPMLHLVRALVKLPDRLRVDLAWVTSETCDVTGNENLVPERAVLHAACKVAGQEVPSLRVVCVDAETANGSGADALAAFLRGELEGPMDDALVAYRAGRRWVPHYRPLDCAPRPHRPLRAGGVYLITGGFGRIGTALACHLVDYYGAKVALVGRHVPEPLRGRLATLSDNASDRIGLYAADIADLDAMEQVIEDLVMRHGALTGAFHAAASVAAEDFMPATSLTSESLRNHYRAKVDGTDVLARVLDGRNVEFCLLFSSLSTIVGGLGFAGYAAANAYLDSYATARSRVMGTTRWVSVDLDAWAAGDGRPGHGTRLPGMVELTERAGLDALCRVLEATDGARVVVTGSPLDGCLRRSRAPQSTVGGSKEQGISQGVRPELSVPYVAPRDDVEVLLAELWEEQLGITGIGVHDPFMELGGHSLGAMQLVSRLRTEFDLIIPLHAFFRAPTVAGMASYVVGLAGAGEDVSCAPGDADREYQIDGAGRE